MLKLYVHLGQGKTGSSAIQSFLNYNREKLAHEYGILYPNFDSQHIDKGNYHNHCKFFKSIAKNESTDHAVEKLLHLKEFCTKNKIEKILLSCEHFENKETLRSLILIITILSCETTLIMYVRRQDLLFESAWKQWGHKHPKIQNIQSFIEMDDVDLKSVFDHYLQYFSTDQFIVRTFEKSSIGQDVVLDFLSIFGIHHETGFIEPLDNSLNKNAGLAPEIVEILKLCNHLNDSIHDNKLIGFMYNTLSDKYRRKDPFMPYGFLSLEERKTIMKKYETSNQEIARLFFKDGREELFLESVEEYENIDVFKGLTLENTIPVFMELIINQYNEIESLKASYQSWPKRDKKDIPNYGVSTCNLFLDLRQYLLWPLVEHQITHKKLQKNGLKLIANGPDPWIMFKNPLEEHFIHAVTISITVQLDTIIQVYVKTNEKDFTEDDSNNEPIFSGQNKIKLHLPLLNQITHFRIDPGQHPGHYIIHSVEIEYTYKI
jgi:hypothetical protein